MTNTWVPNRRMLLAVGVVVVAVGYQFATTESPACQQLRTLLLAQEQGDKHRPMPKDFAYMPFALVEACGPESMRMPYPFKLKLPDLFMEDELTERFFKLDKKDVRTRGINQLAFEDEDLVERDLVNGLGTNFTFTASKDQAMTMEGARECLTGGTCALFFDNTWEYDHMRPLVKGNFLDRIMSHALFGNMFATNLTRTRLTATAHSAAWYGSIAIQLAGAKDWLFYDPATLGAAGVHCNEFTVGATLISKLLPFAGMSKRLLEIDHFNSTTLPGDLLYFPSHWTHIVYTRSGWSTMINLRTKFNLATTFLALRKASLFHSAKGTAKLFLFNTIISNLPDSMRKSLLGGSHDLAKAKGNLANNPEVYLQEFTLLNKDLI